MKLISGIGAAAVALALMGSAQAADMPIMPRKAPPMLVPFTYNWTGFYLGANVGYGWSDGSGSITMGGATGPVSGDGNGIPYGLQLGYNWQFGSWVYGIEADIQATSVSSSITGMAGATTFTGDSKLPWFATLRGRVGYAWDRTMIYVTGGAVYGNAELDGVLSTTGPFSTSKSFWTYTVGGGLEQALWGRWTAKIEYLYVGTPNDVPVPPGTTSISGSINTNLVRAGLNYRF